MVGFVGTGMMVERLKQLVESGLRRVRGERWPIYSSAVEYI